MKHKRAIILLICMCMVCIFAGLLTACGGGEHDYTLANAPHADGNNGVEVVFELEGGTYQNSTRHVRMYYYIPEGGETLISPPGEFSNREITRAKYEISGWFKTRTEVNGAVSYSDEWDFKKDTIKSGDESLTLYCGWVPKSNYTYDICYYDEHGDVKKYTSLKTQAGAPFGDASDHADDRTGFTAKREKDETGKYKIVYYQGKDENGEWIPWDESFVHPGGETDTAVNVFVDYIKGDFVYVSTAEEFISASKNYADSDNGVYLTEDIDLGGKEIGGFRDSAGKFKGAFYGNGHTVSNFTLTCRSTNEDRVQTFTELENNAICIGFFGNLEGAIVENVTIQGMTLNVSIENSAVNNVFIAPFAALAKDSTVKDVNFSAAFTISRIRRIMGEAYIVTDRLFWDESVVTQNCTVKVTLEDKR